MTFSALRAVTGPPCYADAASEIGRFRGPIAATAKQLKWGAKSTK